ncbi:MAG: dihydroneopterin aldolase [Chlamydiota bacterium]|jgi:dihydroneopterin aldolase
MITVGIKNLRIDCIIGILEKEKTLPQTIFIDIEAKPLGENFYDYRIFKDVIKKLLSKGSYGLLEDLGKDIIDVLLEEKKLRNIKLTIKKPQAIEGADFAFITMEKHV